VGGGRHWRGGRVPAAAGREGAGVEAGGGGKTRERETLETPLVLRRARRGVGNDKGRELRGVEGKRSFFEGACKEVCINEQHVSW
jgi:hypothetical protein